MGPLLRLLVICWVSLRESRAYLRFTRGAADPAIPARLVARLVSLGPTFVKLGQILSTRPDVLPPAYIDALATLQEDAPPVPFETVRSILEHDLGRTMAELFASFDQRPVAAASLAQVHRAVLHDGSAVAVKVQRPDLDRLVTRDLDALELGLRVLTRLFPGRMKRTNLAAFFAEFQRYTANELDFANEGRIIERFRANFATRPDVHFPQVFLTHTTRRVLTTGWVDGMRVGEAAATLPPEVRRALVAGVVDVLLKMFISDGLFHADLHPGNILFHADGTFTLVDFGMYGELAAAQRDRFILYWLAVVQRQTRRAFHHFVRQTRALAGADEGAFFGRFAHLAERFYETPLSETSFTKVYLEMMRAGYGYGFVFPRELMLHAKALTTAESLVFVLAPDARFEELSRPFIAREYAARATSLELVARPVSQVLPELLLLGELPPAQALDDEWDWNATKAVASEVRARVHGAVTRFLDQGGLWTTLLEPDIRRALAATRLAGAVDAVLAEMHSRYDDVEATLPVERTFGAVFTTHLAAFTLAMHQTLIQHGFTVEASYRLIYDIGWKFYARMGEPPMLIARALTHDPAKRLRLATDLFRLFPFGAPAYQWRDVRSPEGVVAFDCTRCPVAEFFARHDASELCVQTWCNLDFLLAEKWGGRLERTGSIAMGKPHCDFRWHASTMTD